jgi:hypothetical protein
MVDRRFLGGKGQDEESVELDSQVGVKFSYYVRWTDCALRLRISPKSGVDSKFRSRFNCRVGCGVGADRSTRCALVKFYQYSTLI